MTEKIVYLFDTDIFSNLVTANRNYPALRARAAKEPLANLSVSVILLNELLRRVQPRIQRVGNTPEIVAAYAAMTRLVADIARFQMLPFDEAAYAEFMRIPQIVRQAHPNDCRVAAIAISRGIIIVMRNTRHFEKIPGAKFEDCMLEEAL